jgi:PleD family two-component response regulator
MNNDSSLVHSDNNVKKGSILIVDDNNKNLQSISLIIQNSGFNPAVANSSQNALKYLEFKLTDLILINIMMSGLKGFELCKILKDNTLYSNIPIIIYSEINTTTTIYELLKLDVADDYFILPIENQDLLLKINTQIKLKNALDLIITKDIEITRLNNLISNLKNS